MPATPPLPSEENKPANIKHLHAKRLALAAAFIAVELLGLAGLVMAPRLDLGQVALIAVSGAMVIVPILFAIALRTSKRK